MSLISNNESHVFEHANRCYYTRSGALEWSYRKWKLPSIGAETNLDSLEEYLVVLTTEPSLQTTTPFNFKNETQKYKYLL